MLPEGVGLVLEGGGARTYYSAGVFEAFMDAGIMFRHIVGVSAGIANALSYVSGQKGRNRVIAEKFVQQKAYCGKRNFLKNGSLFNWDYIFREIPERLLYWDIEAFEKVDTRFLAGTVDCITGESVWFDKKDIINKPGLLPIKASCSLPLIARIVKHEGRKLLDGGLKTPISIEKSIEDGNNFHVIVLTNNPGFKSKRFKRADLIKPLYRNYPKLVDIIMNRHEAYNKQLALCEQLEREGKAIILRPQRPMDVTILERDPQKLLRLYDEGHADGAKAVKLIEEHVATQGL